MEKVLIIEDELSIAELQKDYLEKEGFSVSIETDGESGLEAFMENSFDLIILDLMLPKLDGFQVCEEVRKHSQIPVIMVSAKKEDFDKIKGLGCGANDYVTKPFSSSELVARVKAHLSRYQALTNSATDEPKNEIIEIRGLKIDITNRRVWVDNEEKMLTTKEYEMLVLLAKHPNKVFSKDEIFRTIWETDCFGEIATVTVHIKRIREKIEMDPAHPQYIETLWGVGYRIKV